MRANAFLVRWNGGWAARNDVDGERIEASLGLGTVQSLDEAYRIADAELVRFAAGQVEITVGVDPTGVDDVPFADYVVGDRVTVDGGEQVVVALTAAEDAATGRVLYVPQLGDLVESPARRARRTDKKMSNGTLGGSSRVATPISQAPATLMAAVVNGGEGCCSWGFTGFGTGDTLDTATTESFLISVPDHAAFGGGLYIPPDNDVLPAGLWTITGLVTLTFVAAATGSCYVFNHAPDTDYAANPASAGGLLNGQGDVNGFDVLTFSFGGVYLLGAPWSPFVEVTNSTDQDVSTITVTFSAFGTACACGLATSDLTGM